MSRRLAWVLLTASALVAEPVARAAEAIKLRASALVYVDSKGAALKRPEGVACDGKSLVVADSGNGRLVLYDVTDRAVTARGEVVVPELAYPIRVQADPKGGFLVLDGKARRLVRLGTGGEFGGWLDVDAGGSPVVPRSFKVGPEGAVYILDVAGPQVVVADREGRLLRQLAIPDDARFVSDLAVGASGRVFLIDSVGSRVFSAAGDAKTASPLTGSLRQDLDFATAIAVDETGRIFVADQNGGGIVMFGSDGLFRGRQSTFGWGEGQLRYPSALCADGRGNLFVADRENNRIQMFQIREGSEPH